MTISAFNSTIFPSRKTEIATDSARLFCIAEANSSQFVISLPENLTISSPALIPAASAGEGVVPTKQSPKTSTSLGKHETTCLT